MLHEGSIENSGGRAREEFLDRIYRIKQNFSEGEGQRCQESTL
jgi:hypothetical protein